jgi:hypothetical protein
MRRKLIYGVLAAAWLVIAGWQVLEHQRVWEFARRALASRAHDLSAVLSVVIQSQGRVNVLHKL